MTKSVALFTDFAYPDPNYSLNIVAEEQLGMLKRAGYEPIGIVETDFTPERVWNEVELRKVLPKVNKSNSLNWQAGWEAEVEKIYDQLGEALSGVDIVISHDLIYQNSLVLHNIACRRFAKENPNIKWLNWVHSASPSPVWRSDKGGVNMHFPNSKTVYPNEYSIPRVATNFRCEVDDVAFVPHATDPISYLGASRVVRDFVTKNHLLSADVIMVYPVRLDRGKQVEYCIDTVSALKKIGRSARLVVVDFHSTGGDKVTYREELKKYAVEIGLNEAEVSFTSEFIPTWQHGIPREDVRSLFLLSNVFMLPSRSETYSLIAQEAALTGNVLVLNFDFPPIRSVYGEKSVYYKFSANIDALSGMDGETNTRYESRENYFKDVALRVAYELDHNFVLSQKTRVRKERNPDGVFRKFYEPLFHAWDG